MAELPLWLQAGRYQCARQWPYISSVLWSLDAHPVEGLFEKVGAGMGVDTEWRLYYDPALDSNPKANTSPQAVARALMHEVGHILRQHCTRFVGRTDEVVATTPDGKQHVVPVLQLATDYEINDDLDKITVGHDRMYQTLHPSQMDLAEDQLAEWYYDEIIKKAKKNGTAKAEGVGRDCGSCSGGPKRDHEQDGPGKQSAVEKDLLRKLVAEEIRRSKDRGNVPGDLARWADEFLTPVVRWQDKLRSAVARSCEAIVRGKQDYTWAKPSRKSLPSGLVLPSLVQPVPNVAIVADTSGSMGQGEMDRILAETRGILASLAGASVRFISVDAAVHTNAKVRSAKAAKAGLKGGGGTDMRVGIAEAERYKAHITVVLTDGCTPWPAAAPKSKIIVVLTTDGALGDVPAWATTLVV